MATPMRRSDEVAQMRKQWDGIRCIVLYIETQHAKGLLNRAAHTKISLRSRRIEYETYQKTHKEVILPEVKRLVVEYKLQLEVSVGIFDAPGRWRRSQGEPKVPDYMGVQLIIRPAIDLTLLHERKNS